MMLNIIIKLVFISYLINVYYWCLISDYHENHEGLDYVPNCLFLVTYFFSQSESAYKRTPGCRYGSVGHLYGSECLV